MPLAAAQRVLHQALLVLPVALLASAVLCDLLFLMAGASLLSDAAAWLIGGGLLAALASAPLGLFDWLHGDGDRRAVGSVHGLANLLAALLFAVSLWLRLPDPEPLLHAAYLFSTLGLLLAALTGWLGSGHAARRLPPGLIWPRLQARLPALPHFLSAGFRKT